MILEHRKQTTPTRHRQHIDARVFPAKSTKEARRRLTRLSAFSACENRHQIHKRSTPELHTGSSIIASTVKLLVSARR